MKDLSSNDRLLTITVPKESGELVYFTLIVHKYDYLKVTDMTFDSVEDVIQGEEDGHYTINR